MSHPQFSILIPAAGASERLGQAKQLVEYRGKSLIQNAVTSAFSINPGEVIVVTGANAEAVMNAVHQPSVRWVNNPQWRTGMGKSIALGAASISPESSGLMIFLCDQWRIQPQDLRKLAETWRSNPGRIACAETQGRYMPPVIFPSACFNQLQGLEGDQGARNLLKIHPQLVTPVPIENAAFDLDTHSQLDQLIFCPDNKK